MFRWTGITPVYESNGEIIAYNITVDAQNDQNENAFGQITVMPQDLDLSEVNRVTKGKFIEMLTKEEV